MALSIAHWRIKVVFIEDPNLLSRAGSRPASLHPPDQFSDCQTTPFVAYTVRLRLMGPQAQTDIAPLDEANFVVPRQIIYLAEALAPIPIWAQQTMARRVKSSGLEFATFTDAAHHMGVVQNALAHLSPRLDGLMEDIVNNENAELADACRAAGRVQQVLSEFVEGFRAAKATHAVEADAAQARTLILGVYRHHVNVICKWLDELVAAIRDPAAAMRDRGLAQADHIKLTVTLNMTSPPQMAKLSMLANARSDRHEAQCQSTAEIEAAPEQRFEPRQVADSPSILRTLGAIAFGVGFTKAALRPWNR